MFISKPMRVFITLYQEGSLKAAAKKLCLTVPPISRMLRMTEEWFDEPLFIIERNRVKPTPLAESLYQHLLPHYYALNARFHQSKRNLFRLSSPQINNSVFSDLFKLCIEYVSVSISIRQSDIIHNDDDIFVSLQPVVYPVHFSVESVDVILPLCIVSQHDDDWRDSELLIEQTLFRLPDFQHAIRKLHEQGFTGEFRQIDNAEVLKKIFMKGEGVSFLFPGFIDEKCRRLPFSYRQPVYIYINKFKKDHRHEAISSHIKKIIHESI